MARLDAIDDMVLVIDKEEVINRFELPADRIGDIVMISGENMTIGTSEHRHNLAALKEPFRGHGGLTEQEVPFIINVSSIWATLRTRGTSTHFLCN